MTPAEAAGLVAGVDGPAIIIPMDLVRKLGGDLAAAAFLSKAAFLSSVTFKDGDGGWFFLHQIGEPYEPKDPEKKIFAEMGSWENALGISPDAQRAIRRRLREMKLLTEKEEGLPSRLHYCVNLVNYIEFRASNPTNTPVAEKSHNRMPKKSTTGSGKKLQPVVEKSHNQLPGNPTTNKGKKEGKKKSLSACSAPSAQPAAGGGDAMHAEKTGEGESSGPNPKPKPKPKPANRGARSAPPPAGDNGKFGRPHPVAGVSCWDPLEVTAVSRLIASHGEGAVMAAAKKIAEGGRKPLLSYVSNVLKGKTNEHCKSNSNAHVVGQQQPDPDPFAAAAERSRQRRAAAAY